MEGRSVASLDPVSDEETERLCQPISVESLAHVFSLMDKKDVKALKALKAKKKMGKVCLVVEWGRKVSPGPILKTAQRIRLNPDDDESTTMSKSSEYKTSQTESGRSSSTSEFSSNRLKRMSISSASFINFRNRRLNIILEWSVLERLLRLRLHERFEPKTPRTPIQLRVARRPKKRSLNRNFLSRAFVPRALSATELAGDETGQTRSLDDQIQRFKLVPSSTSLEFYSKWAGRARGTRSEPNLSEAFRETELGRRLKLIKYFEMDEGIIPLSHRPSFHPELVQECYFTPGAPEDYEGWGLDSQRSYHSIDLAANSECTWKEADESFSLDEESTDSMPLESLAESLVTSASKEGLAESKNLVHSPVKTVDKPIDKLKIENVPEELSKNIKNIIDLIIAESLEIIRAAVSSYGRRRKNLTNFNNVEENKYRMEEEGWELRIEPLENMDFSEGTSKSQSEESLPQEEFSTQGDFLWIRSESETVTEETSLDSRSVSSCGSSVEMFFKKESI